MCDRVLHAARMRALLLRLAAGDAPRVGGVGGLATRALLDPAALSDDEAALLAEAMAERGRPADAENFNRPRPPLHARR